MQGGNRSAGHSEQAQGRQAQVCASALRGAELATSARGAGARWPAGAETGSERRATTLSGEHPSCAECTDCRLKHALWQRQSVKLRRPHWRHTHPVRQPRGRAGREPSTDPTCPSSPSRAVGREAGRRARWLQETDSASGEGRALCPSYLACSFVAE